MKAKVKEKIVRSDGNEASCWDCIHHMVCGTRRDAYAFLEHAWIITDKHAVITAIAQNCEKFREGREG